jgi:DNA-binding transcriptional MerR regulator
MEQKKGIRRYYSVKQLADLAAVSVRTLHLYDEMGLLKPSTRTETGYRKYGEGELLRLQQILFYKLLDIPLQEIGNILDDPDFNVIEALKSHKSELQKRQSRLTVLLSTIDKTISQLNEDNMLRHEDLYEGLPKETADEYRQGAIKEYGADELQRSEDHLKKMTKEQLAALKKQLVDVSASLAGMMNEDPKSEKVQKLIAIHYAVIREFWGTTGLVDKQAEAYKGLGELYVQDERFARVEGKANGEYAKFLREAMGWWAERELR